MAELWREDLLPFRELQPLLPLLELSTVSYKAYDFDLAQPAAMSSKVVIDLLRVKLGYRRLAVADLGKIARAWSGLDSREAAARCLAAGCDLLVVEESRGEPQKTLRAIAGAIESGRVKSERIEESLARIARVKRRLLPTRRTTEREMAKLARDFEKWTRDFAS